MGSDRHCRWVRHRLPLLVGGELRVEERRKVERHLIACLDCRGHRASSTDAFSALRAFAEVPSPARGDAPSLWPALADQIRQSRHSPAAPSWWEIPLPRAWAGFGLAIGLIAIVAGPLTLLPLGPGTSRSAWPESTQLAPTNSSELVVHSPAAISPGQSIRLDVASKSKNPANPGFDPTASATTQINYDLDHGTPMGPGSRDPQHSY